MRGEQLNSLRGFQASNRVGQQLRIGCSCLLLEVALALRRHQPRRHSENCSLYQLFTSMAPVSSKPALLNEVPPINSIPPELASRFDPLYVKYYNKYQAGRLGTHEVPVSEYRKDPLKYHVLWGRQRIAEDGLDIIEQKCPVKDGEITIRIVKKQLAEGAQETKRPVYINYHGGGWVFGDLETDHDFCKRLVHDLDLISFDVDYRRAPENPYPIPIDDCWTAFNWVYIEHLFRL